MLKKFLISCCALCICLTMSAQKWAVSINAGDLATFGTLNVEGQFACARHVSLDLSARYNPWRFGSDNFRYSHQTYALGVRWWPWFVYSGFWASFRGQYQEYSRTILVSKSKGNLSEEGDAFGAAVSAGYTIMLTKWLNLDFGIGVWGGATKYKSYDCKTCGHRTDADAKAPASTKGFFLPNEAIISLMFVF